jgi:hypothetical protein
MTFKKVIASKYFSCITIFKAGSTSGKPIYDCGDWIGLTMFLIGGQNRWRLRKGADGTHPSEYKSSFIDSSRIFY